MPYEKQVTEEELAAEKRRCWTPKCRNRAWLRDWTGYKHCLKDWYHSLRWGTEHKWFYIKTTRIEL